jgi:hypothetical protein
MGHLLYPHRPNPNEKRSYYVISYTMPWLFSKQYKDTHWFFLIIHIFSWFMLTFCKTGKSFTKSEHEAFLLACLKLRSIKWAGNLKENMHANTTN